MSAPVESKVKAASWAAAVASFAVAWLVVQAPFLASLADPLQAALVAAITTAATAVAGWIAKHTPRGPR